jgi:hypothetical protein
MYNNYSDITHCKSKMQTVWVWISSLIDFTDSLQEEQLYCQNNHIYEQGTMSFILICNAAGKNTI